MKDLAVVYCVICNLDDCICDDKYENYQDYQDSLTDWEPIYE